MVSWMLLLPKIVHYLVEGVIYMRVVTAFFGNAEDWHKFIDSLVSSPHSWVGGHPIPMDGWIREYFDDAILHFEEIHALGLNNPVVALDVLLQLLPLPPAFIEFSSSPNHVTSSKCL